MIWKSRSRELTTSKLERSLIFWLKSSYCSIKTLGLEAENGSRHKSKSWTLTDLSLPNQLSTWSTSLKKISSTKKTNGSKRSKNTSILTCQEKSFLTALNMKGVFCQIKNLDKNRWFQKSSEPDTTLWTWFTFSQQEKIKSDAGQSEGKQKHQRLQALFTQISKKASFVRK